MASKPKTLHDAFYETLRDVYYAEKQSIRSLGKSAKLAQAEALKTAIEEHRDESAHQVERLEQVFELIGKPSRAKTCEAMRGIASELEEDLEDFGETEAADAVLIAGLQAAEHYEIARYGVLKTWARQLGMGEAEKLLGETLEEEKRADERLSAVAEEAANARGAQGESEPAEEGAASGRGGKGHASHRK